MYDLQADPTIVLALVATIVAAGISLRHRIDVPAARTSLGDPAYVAVVATALVLGLAASSFGVVYIVWFTAAATSALLSASPLLFATWLMLLFMCTRECLRGVLLLTGCAPTAAAGRSA